MRGGREGPKGESVSEEGTRALAKEARGVWTVGSCPRANARRVVHGIAACLSQEMSSLFLTKCLRMLNLREHSFGYLIICN